MTTTAQSISIMTGPRDWRVQLPIESRYPIFVRPAYRPDDKTSWITMFVEMLFSA